MIRKIRVAALISLLVAIGSTCGIADAGNNTAIKIGALLAVSY
jgi:hypothetical protein